MCARRPHSHVRVLIILFICSLLHNLTTARPSGPRRLPAAARASRAASLGGFGRLVHLGDVSSFDERQLRHRADLVLGQVQVSQAENHDQSDSTRLSVTTDQQEHCNLTHLLRPASAAKHARSERRLSSRSRISSEGKRLMRRMLHEKHTASLIACPNLCLEMTQFHIPLLQLRNVRSTQVRRKVS